MTYKEAVAIVEDLRSRFDSPFGASDKATIEKLYIMVARKQFVPTTCQQCYHDALIEIYLTLKKLKAMPEQCNYRMKAGFIISCPDFHCGKIFTNENLTDEVAAEYLGKFPEMQDYFQKVPEEKAETPAAKKVENPAEKKKKTVKDKKPAAKKVEKPAEKKDEGINDASSDNNE